MTTRIRTGVMLALGLLLSLVSSCGPDVFGMSHCGTSGLYDAPDYFPECAPASSFCGDARCDRSRETHAICPGDCPPPRCGDGVCEEGEGLSCPDCEPLLVCCCCGSGYAFCRTTSIDACECAVAPAASCRD